MSYQLKKHGVKRLADSMFIPNDLRNRDWREYLDWVTQGNTAAPDDPDPALPDLSDSDNLEKALKAILLVAAAWNGKTPAQARAAFKTAWDALP